MEKNTYIIGITGGSGSGKTTFIRQLRDAFTMTDLCVVSQDDYYKSREEQMKDKRGVTNFDRPECFDVPAFERDLKRLIAGEAVERMEYTFNNALKTAEQIIFKPAPVIIVEGLFILHFESISKLLDLKVFIEAHDALKVKRRILRDQMERNYPLEDVLYRYEHHVLPAYRKYIGPYRADADIIINNHSNFEQAFLMLSGFIKYHIKKTPQRG